MAEDKKYYVHGPKEDTPKNTSSLGEFFARVLADGGDKIAQLIETNGQVKTLTYAEILHKGKVAAGLFKKHCIKPRDTVVAVSDNSLDYAPIFWGTQFNAATIAVVNPLYDIDDMLHLIRTIEPQLVVVNADAESRVKEALTQYDTPVECITMAEIVKYIDEHPDVSDFQLAKVEDPDADVASIICTTGSSGKPKCVEISHTSLFRQLGFSYFKSDNPNAVQLVSANVAGPFGIAGQLNALMSLYLGMKSILFPIESFDGVAFLRLLEKYKVNFTGMGACQLIALTKCASIGEYDLSNMKQIIIAGSPISSSMSELARKHLGLTISVGYGMTEAMGVCNPVYSQPDRPCTIGKPAANVIVKIVDVETGKALGPRKEGEFRLKAPSMMLRYRNNPGATKSAFDDEGFLRTGDTAFYDEDGYFYIVDRIKELIKYRNVHVPASDIEDLLIQHPKVAEAAVIGVYHETDWEHATAIVATQPGETVSEEELVKLVQDNLPELKWLRGGVRFVASIPKSPNGKFNKRQLRAQYAAMPDNLPSVNQK